MSEHEIKTFGPKKTSKVFRLRLVVFTRVVIKNRPAESE